MRRTITWLLILVIASMLVGTALAECAALMPCCSQNPTNCDEICAAPTSNTNAALVPQVPGDIQVTPTVGFIVPAPHSVAPQIRRDFASSSEDLLRRIHVLLG